MKFCYACALTGVVHDVNIGAKTTAKCYNNENRASQKYAITVQTINPTSKQNSNFTHLLFFPPPVSFFFKEPLPDLSRTPNPKCYFGL